MSRAWLWAACAVALAIAAPPAAQAHKSSYHANHNHSRAAKVRYGGKAGLGYWRPGPRGGPRFGFASYKGDPFGGDDYYEGRRCYYVNHSNFCAANHIFTGFD